jgi:hypothetical protein
MNERIKLLAEQAQIRLFEDKSFGWSVIAGTDQHLEKFAELIVEECVKVMYENAIKRKVPPDINQTPTHYAVAVLEHFGLKTLDKLL